MTLCIITIIILALALAVSVIYNLYINEFANGGYTEFRKWKIQQKKENIK